jgi:anti-sigma factor RsiW
MASESDKDLQRYFDGELSPGRARRVHRRLQESPEERKRLESMEQMRSMLRESTQAAADEASFDHLWTRVRAGVEKQEPLGLGERLTFWLKRYGLALASATAAAVVAVVLITSSLQPETPARNDAVIESIETGPEVTSTIFTIDDPEETGETTVIWVTETSAEGDM